MSKYNPILSIILGLSVTTGVVVATLGVRGQKSDQPPVHFFFDMKYQPRYNPQAESPYFEDGRTMRGDRFKPSMTDRRVAFAGTDYFSDAGFLVAPDTRFLAADVTYFRGWADATEKDELDPTGKPTGRKTPNWQPRIPLAAFLTYRNTVVSGEEQEALGKLPEAERNKAVFAKLLKRGQERYNVTCINCHGATGGKFGEPTANGITTQYGMAGVANYHQQRLWEMPDGEIYNTIANGKNTMMPYGHLLKVEDRWAVVAYVRALQRAQLGSAEGDVPAEAKLN
jgi:mono/diheme cytochrome c family protein